MLGGRLIAASIGIAIIGATQGVGKQLGTRLSPMSQVRSATHVSGLDTGGSGRSSWI
jgi:hypothetical protein